MGNNLLRSAWSGLNSGDLIAVLNQTFGGSQLADNDEVAYPNADEARITAHYCRGRIASITPGPAFDRGEWDRLAQRVKSELLAFTPGVARRIAFCDYRVEGWWRSDKLGVQLLPPPPQAPDATVAYADHPFVLEYPIMRSSNWLITNNRDGREFRRLTGLLNVLLEGRITSVQPTLRHLWAFVETGEPAPRTVWVQEGYSCPDFVVNAVELSEPEGDAMTTVSADEYYAIEALDLSRDLQVPDTLESSLEAYHNLSPEQRERFDIACRWWDVKDRVWTISISGSYAATISAVEALLPKSSGFGSCEACHRSLAPGPTGQFREFLETYAPGGGIIAQARGQMYRLRSAVIHGDKLMRYDLDVEWGITPATIAEHDLHSDLRRLVKVALVNWLHKHGGAAAIAMRHPANARGGMMSKTISLGVDTES